jgi:hypothetical protein
MADDLKVEGTPGFKVGEKKTIDEYQKLGKCHTRTAIAVMLAAFTCLLLLVFDC